MSIIITIITIVDEYFSAATVLGISANDPIPNECWIHASFYYLRYITVFYVCLTNILWLCSQCGKISSPKIILSHNNNKYCFVFRVIGFSCSIFQNSFIFAEWVYWLLVVFYFCLIFSQFLLVPKTQINSMFDFTFAGRNSCLCCCFIVFFESRHS